MAVKVRRPTRRKPITAKQRVASVKNLAKARRSRGPLQPGSTKLESAIRSHNARGRSIKGSVIRYGWD